MQRVTLSAEDDVLERARLRAAREGTTLNAAFREWLRQYGGAGTTAQEYRQLMRRLSRVRSGKKCTREELTQR